MITIMFWPLHLVFLKKSGVGWVSVAVDSGRLFHKLVIESVEFVCKDIDICIYIYIEQKW